MWGFQSHGVIPDIVTMAKGIANGFPMGAIVTTPGEFNTQHASVFRAHTWSDTCMWVYKAKLQCSIITYTMTLSCLKDPAEDL